MVTDVILSVLAGGLLLAVFIISIQDYYKFYFEWIQDVDLNKVLVIWYNKYTRDGISREHKIIYDTGRNKRRYPKDKK